jgi:hypothetical protein
LTEQLFKMIGRPGVAESYAPGAVVSVVARRHNISDLRIIA